MPNQQAINESAEAIKKSIDDITCNLERDEYKEVLEEIYSDVSFRLEALDEEEQS